MSNLSIKINKIPRNFELFATFYMYTSNTVPKVYGVRSWAPI
jgi:hypothetical protein